MTQAKPIVTLKDKDPHRTHAQILGDLEAAENLLQMDADTP